MTVEILLWVVAIGLFPVIGWFFKLQIQINRMESAIKAIKKQNDQLLNMHEHPDDYGFGTSKTNKIIEDNTRAMSALTHYIRWFVQEQTGKEPPPPIN